ncbi:hypothetical protein [Mycobacterium phage WXIN]|nr:hypothetical protein [Mycobacterium phage WXIN]
MRMGGQTVVFVTVTEDPTQRDRYKKPLRIETDTPVRGCRFRPLTAEEKTNLSTSNELRGDIDVITDPWRCTTPPSPTVMNAGVGDVVKVDGVTYQIIGLPRVFPDFRGRPFKCTVLVDRQIV